MKTTRKLIDLMKEESALQQERHRLAHEIQRLIYEQGQASLAVEALELKLSVIDTKLRRANLKRREEQERIDKMLGSEHGN